MLQLQRRVILFLNSVPGCTLLCSFMHLLPLLLSLPQEAHFIVAILLWYEKNCWSLFHYSRRLLNDILWLWHFFGQIKKFYNIKWLKIEAGSDLESRLWIVPELQLKVNCRKNCWPNQLNSFHEFMIQTLIYRLHTLISQ